MSLRSTVAQRKFEQLLPLLVSTYLQGKLVPFLGAGMSTPRLVLWHQFIENLEQQAPPSPFGKRRARTESLEARAGRACAGLRNSVGPACFLEVLNKALLGGCPD